MQALPKEIRARLSALSGPQGEEACEELRGLIHEGGAGGVAAELARNQKGMEALARALTGESEAMRLCAASCFRWVVFFFLCLVLVHLKGVIQARLAAGQCANTISGSQRFERMGNATDYVDSNQLQ